MGIQAQAERQIRSAASLVVTMRIGEPTRMHSFTSGLAAMPSLHNAGALMFLLFAWKYGRPLLPPFALAFGFIVITSIATRWHYVADLPVGWLLGWVSFRIGERFGDAPNSMTFSAKIETQRRYPRRA